jgi:glutaredoxin
MFKIISKPGCTYCEAAKTLLTSLEFNFVVEELTDPDEIEEFKAQGFTTFPQIYRGKFLIGGHSDLLRTIKDQLAWN